jgi:hypothetical protein
MADPKALAAAKKEGGKKGQDLCGMADMGGIRFFHVAIDNANGVLTDFVVTVTPVLVFAVCVDPVRFARRFISHLTRIIGI